MELVGRIISKIKLTSFILLIIPITSNGQTNYINNHNFDSVTACPSNWDDICKAYPWFQPQQYGSPWPPCNICNCGSSNIFHTCVPYDSNFTVNSIPINMMGYQYPKSGNGYVGIIIYGGIFNPDSEREYIEIKLNALLNNNKDYCVKWYSSLANKSRNGSNRIGAYFSLDTLFQTGPQLDYIPLTPQVENLEIITDTANWVLFKQIFTAQGGEQFMTIGNFRAGVNTDTSFVINQNGWVVYYYFDDFGVYELPEIEAGNDDSICTTGGSVQISANCTGCWSGLQYRWWPATGLNDTTVLNPIASPTQTTTYYFGLLDTSNTVPCIIDLIDSVTVYVCDSIANPAPPPNTDFTFSIYPNPGQATLTLNLTSLQEDIMLYIYDARGRLVLKQNIAKGTQTMDLNIADLSNGMYVLKLQNAEIKEIRKFIKN